MRVASLTDIPVTHNYSYGVSGNMNWIESKFSTDNAQIRIQYRMMSIKPYIADIVIWEYTSRTGRKPSRRTQYYIDGSLENRDLYELDSRRYENSVLLPFSKLPPYLIPQVNEQMAKNIDFLLSQCVHNVCGLCGESVWNARSTGKTILVSSNEAENRCSKCFKG